MPGKMHLRSAGRAPTPTEPSTVNARSVHTAAKRPAAKKKTKVAPRPQPTAHEKRMEAATKKLINNALYQGDFEKRGNPGVFAPFQPISDQEWEQDWAAMQPVPPPPPPTPNNNDTNNNAAMNSSTASGPQKKDKAKEPSVRSKKRKATEAPSEPARPSKRKATEPHTEAVHSKEQPTEPVSDNTRKSERLAEKRPRNDADEPKEAPAKKKSKPSSKRPKANNTGQRNRATAATSSSHSVSNAAGASQNSASNPIVIPDHNSASNPMIIPAAGGPSSQPATTALRSRSDPVTGSNGFRLLHQQHHFVRGPDQTAHLTIRFVDNTQPGVTQTHTYTSRKQGGRAPQPIDWDSAADIARLNRWMCQFLKRSGAASLRQDVVSYTPEEREWLRALGRQMAGEIERGERNAAYTRDEQVRLFNDVWAGTIIQTGRHAGKQRPVRSAASLESEIHRSGLYPAGLKKSKN
ncbi:hypothetical protein DBV05_g9283 [Lasiodiplodia theobromae]|uniref:Uncharacterized protein n=1 Tax=Lasiodiplodia theobromae TaxID=45133 RepID=A0A5N5D3R7_9PEZI|nr:hypothetical protein DBV05_g9283 [Lasiodiplodia theobromae]